MMGTGPVPRSTEQGTPHLRRTVDAGHTRSSSEPLRRVRKADALRARNDELAGQLRAAALEGDEARSEEHTSELQSQSNLVCRLLLEKNNRVRERRHGLAEPLLPPGDALRARLGDPHG